VIRSVDQTRCDAGGSHRGSFVRSGVTIIYHLMT
jgi:hypothetical protein